jgi:hypothetical protein
VGISLERDQVLGWYAWRCVLMIAMAAPACGDDGRSQEEFAPDRGPAAMAPAESGASEQARGEQNSPAAQSAPVTGRGVISTGASGAGQGETLCRGEWNASQGPNLGPLALTWLYPPWLLPLIAADGAGEAVVGVNAPRTSLADGAPDAGDYAAVVAKLDLDCKPVWTRTLASPSMAATLTSLQVDPDSNLLLAGWLRGALDYGDGVVGEVDDEQGTGLFISKLDASGEHVWTRVFATGENISELRIGPRGQLVLSGTALASADFGAGPICARVAERDQAAIERGQQTSMSTCSYLAVFDGDGKVIWSQGRPESFRRELAVFDHDGNLLQARAELTAGDGERSMPTKLDAAGALLWTVDLGALFGIPIRSAVAHKERQLATGPGGVIAHLEPQVSQADEDARPDDGNLFGGLFEPHRSALSLLDAAGAPLWIQTVGDFSGGRAGALAMDAQGRIVLAGEFTGETEVASTRLQARGERDVFVTELDPAGAPRWSARVGADRSEWASALALSTDGSVWVSGWIGTTRVSAEGTLYDNLLREGIFVARVSH